MLTALNSTDQLVVSIDVSPQEGPFFCPGCRGPTIHKSGPHKMAHFAHKAGTSPEYCDRVAESLEHERIKLAIYEGARAAKVVFTQPEFKIKDHIIDVAIIGESHRVAVEVQLSPMKRDDILARVAGHAAAGFITLWVVKTPEPTEGLQEKYRIRAFQRDIHELSKEALFVHRHGLVFDVIHLMGFSHVTMFYMKPLFSPLHLFELDCSGPVVAPPEKSRWWERLRPPKSPWKLGFESKFEAESQPWLLG